MMAVKANAILVAMMEEIERQVDENRRERSAVYPAFEPDDNRVLLEGEFDLDAMADAILKAVTEAA